MNQRCFAFEWNHKGLLQNQSLQQALVLIP